jgi:MerR family transcriptional regulator, copper efflux regulator
MGDLLTIGKAADLAGLPSKTIRYYQEVGLLPEGQRSEAGYRLFSATDIRRLRLIRRARILGLSLKDVKEIVDLAFVDGCGAFETRLGELIQLRIDDINRTVDELTQLKGDLISLQQTLASGEQSCGDCRADECERCRFIDD